MTPAKSVHLLVTLALLYPLLLPMVGERLGSVLVEASGRQFAHDVVVASFALPLVGYAFVVVSAWRLSHS